jgi:hypothetical protein
MTHTTESAFPNEKSYGMNKLELFSAIALQGILANPEIDLSYDNMADMAVKSAVALIVALNKRNAG